MKFEVVRYQYEPDRTLGKLFIDDVEFCWTLEDKVRPDGVKVYGETAIPEGTYLVTIEPFRGNTAKMYPYLHDVPMFTGVCMHGGNGPEDTLGCILVGYHEDDSTKRIYDSAILELSAKMQAAEKPVHITVRNGG